MPSRPTRLPSRRLPAGRKPSLLRPSRLAVWQLDDRIVPAGTVTGTLFRDFNANGVFESAPRTIPNAGGGSVGTVQDQPYSATSVTVRAFDAANQLAGQTATGPNGTYTLNLTGTGPYRVEFSGLPAGYSFGPAGATNTAVSGAGTTVQFVPEGGAAGVNLGLVRPEDISADNPLLATSQFVYGGIDQQNGSFPVVQAFPYSSGQTVGDALAGDSQTTRGNYANPQTHAISIPHSQVGAVWGLAYDKADRDVLMAAYYKRHSGYGPGGPGAIYRAAAPAAGQQTTTASLLVNLNTATDLGNGGVNPAGVSYRPTTTPADDYYFSDGLANNQGWDSVGNQGLGGIDVSPDGRFAYTVALGNKRLFVIDLDTLQVRSYAIPAPTGVAAGDFQPFAVTVHDGQVFVGAVNTAQSLYPTTAATNPTPGSADDLLLQAARAAMRGYVFRFDPGADPAVGGSGRFVDGAGTAATAPVFSFPLNYDRGYAHPGRNRSITTDDLSGNWRPWSPVYRNLGLGTQDDPESAYPQPMFTGLSFDADGSMVIGLRDRAGDQFGVFTPADPTQPNLRLYGITAGDMLRAAPATGGTWALESNGAVGGVTSGLPAGVNPADPAAGTVNGVGNGQGPGGGEFYSGDYLVPSPPGTVPNAGFQQEHQEVFVGGVLQLSGFPNAASTAFDPAQVAAGFNSGGVRWLHNAGANAGTLDKAYELYVQNFSPGAIPFVPPPLFAKTNGVGDLIALNDTSLEIGNRVWQDTNGNGLQDAGEAGIGGLQVLLFSGGTQVAVTTTAADGSYLFSDQPLPANPVDGRAYGVPLRSGASYQVRIPLAQPPLAGYRTTTFQSGLPAGASNLIQLDLIQSDARTVGTDAVIDVAALGAAGANHTYDAGFTLTPTLNLGDFVWNDVNNDGLFNTGEVGIPNVVVNLLAPGGATLTATTNQQGGYLFTGLAPGQYRVQIPAGQTALAGFVSSSGANGQAFGPYEPQAGEPANGPNSTDHGVLRNGFVVGPLVTLAIGQAPIREVFNPPGGLGLDDGLVADESSDRTQDFGFYQPLSLGDTVWVDPDNDGVRQPTEAPLPGVTVQLLDGTGNAVGSTTTNANGGYLFQYLTQGQYTVRLVRDAALAGYNASTGGNPAANPPVNDRSAGTQSAGFVSSPTVTLALGGAVTADAATQPAGLPDDSFTLPTSRFRNVDFGLYPILSLGDRVWNDLNNDGLYQTGEPGVGGVTVTLVGLDATNAGTLTTTTASDGGYLFTNLRPGRYQVVIPLTNNPSLVGYTSSTGRNGSATGPFEPAPVSATNNQDHGTTAGATVTGPVVNLQPGQAPTDDLDGPASVVDAASNANSDRSQDLGFFRPLAVGDLVWRDTNTDGRFSNGEAGIPGVTVTLRDGTDAVVATTTTGSDGRYLFTNLVAGTYSVQIVPPTGLVNSTPAPDAQPANDQNRGVTQADGTIAAVAFTLAPFEASTNPDQNGAANLRQDFGLTGPTVPPPPPPSVASLGGTVYIDANLNGVRDAGEQGLPDVRILLDGVTTGGTRVTREQFTDANGRYLFTGLPAGTYAVRQQSPTGTLFNVLTTVGSAGGRVGTDLTTGIALPAGTDAVNYDFGEVLPVSTFGYVWQDVNSPRGTLPTDYNGVRDPGEFPIPDTTVTVSGTAFAGTRFARPLTAADVPGGLSAVTGPNGRYDFLGLPPGTYTLSETQPADYDDFREQNGDPYGPAPAISNDVYTGITLVPGAIRGPFNYGEGSTIDPTGSRRPVDATKREFLSSTRPRAGGEFSTTPAQVDPGSSVPVPRLNLFPNLTASLNRTGTISLIATGAGFGASPVVRVFDTAAGVERFRFLAYEQGYTGGVQTAVGDVDGDGVPDIVTAVAQDGGPRVRVFSGKDASVIQDFFAYESTFTGGLNLAVGDVDGDGRADIVTGTNVGGGARVRVFDGRTLTVLQDFFAFDQSQRGGVRVAAADLNKDGRADLVVTTGAGVPTRVRVFDAATSTATVDFAPFESAFVGGATIAAGDFDGDGTPDLIVGADFGGGPRVAVFSGRDQTSLVSFFAFEPTFTGGVRVAARDVDGDGRDDLVTGAGLGGSGRVTVYSGAGLGKLQDFFATDADQPNGVYVGVGATPRKTLAANGAPVASGQLNRVGAVADLPADFARPVTT